MTLTSKVLAALFLAMALAGCGQSGPLYVPGNPSSVEEPATTESNEEADENNEEDEG